MDKNAVIPKTLDEILKWALTYHNRKQAILWHNKATTFHYLACGKLLCDADKAKDWKHDGSCANNFFQWVEHELCFKRTNAQRMMVVWLAFKEIITGTKGNLILEIDFSKLVLIAPYMAGETEEERMELIHSAKELSVRALENNLRERNGGGIATDVCTHTGAKKILEICKGCGQTLSMKEI